MPGQSVGAVYVDAILNNKNFNKQVNSTVKGAEKSFTSSFGKIGAAITAALSVAAVGAFAKASVDAAMQAESAFMGLNSQLTAQGRSFSEAKKFLEEYTADGLVPMTNAANAYKQLASRGFDDKQIQDMMHATKDMATYNRQAHYSMGEAVEVFAQGLKNEESTLTDAAGMTKNLSVIWDEYAQTIGKTGATLTQTEKVQAEYLATMNEWRYSAGNAATMAGTFQGRLAALKATFTSIKTEIGNVIIPIANLFMPAIQAAANAVLNFIVRIKQLLAIFGLEMQEIGGGSSGAQEMASGFNAAAGSAGAAADAIGSTGEAATAAAKAVKRALAPYDELNKLTFAKDSSGSAGSSGGSTGGGTSAVPDTSIAVKQTADAVSPAVEKMSATMQRFLEPLKNISFDNLINAFKTLKESAKELGGTIWDGLEWAYFNIFVPLAEWTIEDVLPAFLYALSGALDAVNGILKEVAPAFEWLWEKFLKPIAQWTGGVIVDVLYAIGDGLKWIGDNANIVVPALAGVAGAVGAVKGLKIAASVIDFVKYAGGLAGATTIWTKIAAAFGQLWTYFKASGVWTAITGAFKGLAGGATALAGALGISVGALAGIVAAVAAAAVGVYLLIKNWDEVVAWFKKLPEKISAAWNAGKAAVKKAWDNLVGMVKDKTANMRAKVATTWNNIKGAWESTTKNIKDKWANMKARVATSWNNIKGAWSNTTKNIKDKTANMKAKIGTTWASLRGKWNSLINNFRDKTVTVSLKIKSIISDMKSWVNSNVIKKINKFVPFVKIPYLAQGGWLPANAPQLAVVGDNRREGEIVAPESKIREQVKQAISEMGGGMMGTIRVEIAMPDGRVIAKEINRAQMAAGRVLLNV